MRPGLAGVALLAAGLSADQRCEVASRAAVVLKRLPALPLSFEPNVGQAPDDAAAVVHVAGRPALVSSRGVRIGGAALALVGAAAARAELLDAQGGLVSYFIGDDPAKWRSGVPTFARVRFREVWPGIGVVFHGERGRLELDFEVEPGADAGLIRLALRGGPARATGAGELVASVGADTLTLGRPVTYQGEREVAAAYVLRGSEVTLALGPRDARRPLLVDPTIVYSSYLGGALSDYGVGVAVDSTGAFYLGRVASMNFPTAGTPVQSTLSGASDAYVAKVNAAGTALVFCTYIGGTQIEVPYGIAVDAMSRAVITGYTASNNYPVSASAYQKTLRGGADAFITMFDATGSTLVFSTLLGGNNFEDGFGVAVDATGVYVAGDTASSNFVTMGAIQTTLKGTRDGFVAKLNTTGSALVYATYLGGSGSDGANAIAVDATGAVYVTGETASLDFPIGQNPLQGIQPGGGNDAFVVKLTSTGLLGYATYLGGMYTDTGNAIAVDSSGSAYVTGFTVGGGFPIGSALYGTYLNGGDAFITKLNATGSAVVFSTFMGGSGADYGAGIAVDPNSGEVTIGGYTSSTDLPLVGAVQQQNNGGPFDGFVTTVNATDTQLVFQTYLGGTGNDQVYALAVDGKGGIYVSSSADTNDAPVLNALFPGFGGQIDGIIAKLQLDGGAGDGGSVDAGGGGSDGGTSDGGSASDGGSTNDGGSASDGGSANDGGSADDAGSANDAGANDDGGSTSSDGGFPGGDGGFTSFDGGTTDGGDPLGHTPLYEVGCGCNAGTESLLVLAALASLARRRRK